MIFLVELFFGYTLLLTVLGYITAVYLQCANLVGLGPK